MPTSTHRRPRILLGITGSVASVKGPEIALRLLKDVGADIKIVLTKMGEQFWNQAKLYNEELWDELQNLLHRHNREVEGGDGDKMIQIYRYNDEWIGRNPIDDPMDGHYQEMNHIIWEKVGDPVLHIQLRHWADLALIAPLSAHTLAKISNGFCDDLLTCILRAWDFTHEDPKPIVLAPAMNTAMWDHPITKKQLKDIVQFGNVRHDIVRIVEPQIKKLACGDFGNGALADVSDIIEAIEQCLGNQTLENPAPDATGVLP